MRLTFSPGTVRTASPAPSSVVTISESAVDSHCASCRLARFLKPSTAMAGRLIEPFTGPASGSGALVAGADAVNGPHVRQAIPAAATTSTASAAITSRRGISGVTRT